MTYAVLSVVLLYLFCAVRALRDEHLVLLRWPSGTFLLERVGPGRYDKITFARLPLAVLHFGGLRLVSAAHGLRRRAQGVQRPNLGVTVRTPAVR